MIQHHTGETFTKVFDVVKGFDCDFAFLMTRYKDSNAPLVGKVLNHEKWIVFPWERNTLLTTIVYVMSCILFGYWIDHIIILSHYS